MDKTFLARLHKNNIVRALIVTALICLVYTLWVSKLKPVMAGSQKMTDVLFVLHSKLFPLHDKLKNVILVSIDDASMTELGIRWPWPRGLIAGLVKNISQGKPKVICIDFAFIGKSTDRNQDLTLAKTFKDAGNVIIGSYFGSDGRYVRAENVISNSVKALGFVNKPRDVDVTIRRMRPFVLSTKGKIIDYSLGIKVASEFLNKSEKQIASKVPLLKDNTAHIYFFGAEHQTPTIPSWRILKDKKVLSRLKNKVVFLGVTSKIFHDIYETPLGTMSGVNIIANESLTYITQNFFKYTSSPIRFLVLFLFTFIAVFSASRLSITSGLSLSFLEIVLFFIINLFLFHYRIVSDSIGVIVVISLTVLLLYGGKYINVVLENITLRKESVTDGLTQLYIHRYFDIRLKREFTKAAQENKNLVLAILDIDHFKNINDTYGHEFGNIVIKSVAKIIKNNCRKSNVVCRYGGDEFTVIMRDTNLIDAMKCIQRLKNVIEQMFFDTDDGKTIGVTLSIGMAQTKDNDFKKSLDFIQAADSALYKSKQAGRNRTSVFKKS